MLVPGGDRSSSSPVEEPQAVRRAYTMLLWMSLPKKRWQIRFRLRTLIAIVTGIAVGLGVRQSWLRLNARRAYCRSPLSIMVPEESRWRSLAGIDEARARELLSEAALCRWDAESRPTVVDLGAVKHRAEVCEREANPILEKVVNDDLRLAEDHARVRRLYDAASQAHFWSPDPPLDPQ